MWYLERVSKDLVAISHGTVAKTVLQAQLDAVGQYQNQLVLSAMRAIFDVYKTKVQTVIEELPESVARRSWWQRPAPSHKHDFTNLQRIIHDIKRYNEDMTMDGIQKVIKSIEVCRAHNYSDYGSEYYMKASCQCIVNLPIKIDEAPLSTHRSFVSTAEQLQALINITTSQELVITIGDAAQFGKFWPEKLELPEELIISTLDSVLST